MFGEFTSLIAKTDVRRAQVRRTDKGEPLPKLAEDQVAVSGVLVGGAVAAVHHRGSRSGTSSFR